VGMLSGRWAKGDTRVDECTPQVYNPKKETIPSQPGDIYPKGRGIAVFVILTQTRLNGQQVYRTVCYGPFETAAEAHYLARECLDGEPATVIQLLPLVSTGLTSGVAEAIQPRATTRVSGPRKDSYPT